MKKLFLMLAFIFCTLNIFSQYHYKIGIETINNYGSKDIVTEIRNNGIKAYNLIMNDTIEFDSPNLTDSTKISNFLSGKAIVKSFESSKNNLGFNKEKSVTGGVNCSNATNICSNTTFNANSNGHGVQELNNNNNGCLYGNEHQSSWYYLYVESGGILTMTIEPQHNEDDYDFAIWGPFTPTNAIDNCPPTSQPIRCSYANPYWSPFNTTGMSHVLPYLDDYGDQYSNGWIIIV